MQDNAVCRYEVHLSSTIRTGGYLDNRLAIMICKNQQQRHARTQCVHGSVSINSS